MMTNQKQIRELFWDTFPTLPRRRYRNSLHRRDVTAPMVYHIGTRCAFVDFVDYLERDGQISAALAARAEL